MTAPALPALLALARAARELQTRREARPLDYVRWMRPQARWLALPSRAKILRAGNQIAGKSWAGIADVVWRCLGRHPYLPDLPTPPIEVIVCNLNHTQSLAIQQKFYDLLPHAELARGCVYSPSTGWRANNPQICFKNKSRIRFVTDDQGPRAVAGATVDLVWIDEPCSPEMMRELRQRLVARAGTMLLTLTPINGPVSHIEEAIARGEIDEVHAPLCLDTLTYDGSDELRALPDGTVCDQTWIDARWASEPAMWAPIVLDGEWRTKALGAYFSAVWDAAAHVSDRARLDPAAGETRWHLGIDYATADRPDGLVAVLVQVQQTRADPARPPVEHVVVEDCVVLPGTATMTMFATDIISMISRAGLRWRDLKSVYGDNPVSSRFEFKSNLDLSRKLTHELQVPQNALSPRILGAKEGVRSSASRDAGCRYLYELMASKRIVVRPRCSALIEAIEQWDYSATHRAKDRIDALRYSLKEYVFSASNPHSKTTLRVA